MFFAKEYTSIDSCKNTEKTRDGYHISELTICFLWLLDV